MLVGRRQKSLQQRSRRTLERCCIYFLPNCPLICIINLPRWRSLNFKYMWGWAARAFSRLWCWPAEAERARGHERVSLSKVAHPHLWYNWCRGEELMNFLGELMIERVDYSQESSCIRISLSATDYLPHVILYFLASLILFIICLSTLRQWSPSTLPSKLALCYTTSSGDEWTVGYSSVIRSTWTSGTVNVYKNVVDLSSFTDVV